MSAFAFLFFFTVYVSRLYFVWSLSCSYVDRYQTVTYNLFLFILNLFPVPSAYFYCCFFNCVACRRRLPFADYTTFCSGRRLAGDAILLRPLPVGYIKIVDQQPTVLAARDDCPGISVRWMELGSPGRR